MTVVMNSGETIHLDMHTSKEFAQMVYYCLIEDVFVEIKKEIRYKVNPVMEEETPKKEKFSYINPRLIEYFYD